MQRKKNDLFFCLVQFLRVRFLRTAELLSLVGVLSMLSVYLLLRTFCDIQTILRRAYTASAKLDSVRRGNNSSVDFLGLSELTNQFSLELLFRNMFPRHDKQNVTPSMILYYFLKVFGRFIE